MTRTRQRFGLVVSIAAIYGLAQGMTASTRQTPSVPPISKATASVQMMPGESRVIVSVRNISDVALEAWGFRLEYDLGSGPSSFDLWSDAGLDPNDPNGGVIKPRTTRTKILTLPGIPVSASASVVMLILSDGTFEGAASDRDAVLRDRERNAAVLALWIDTLTAVSGRQGSDAKNEIERLRRADSRYTPDKTNAFALALDLNMKELLAMQGTDQLAARLAALLDKYKAQRERALRHKGR